MLDLIAAAPANSWIKANTNTIQSVFGASDLTPAFGSGVGSPSAIIRAWSSFAWDSNRSRLILFGGGHANYGGNDTYMFDMRTRIWSLAFAASDVVAAPAGYVTVDGPLKSPISSHTYGNNCYLPKLDRFLTFGGAAHSSGSGFQITDSGGNPVRNLSGGYLCDLALAGQGFVGGASGSNVKRNTTLTTSLAGANAWAARDYVLDHANTTIPPAIVNHKNAGTQVVTEGGKDVIYFTAGVSTTPSLFKITYNDLDYRNDSMAMIGQGWTNGGKDTGLGYDPVRLCAAYLNSATVPLYFWDVSAPSTTNRNKAVADTGLTGSGSAAFLAVSSFGSQSILYDPVRQRFAAWGRGGAVFSIVLPAGTPVPETGWVVTQLTDNTASPRPAIDSELLSNEVDTGVTGKWHYAKDMDVYIGLQHTVQGNVWVFKPAGWVDPRN
jgi:hypothetical protein